MDRNEPLRDRKNRTQISSPWVPISKFFSEQGLTHKIDELHLKVRIYEEKCCFHKMFVMFIEYLQLHYVD